MLRRVEPGRPEGGCHGTAAVHGQAEGAGGAGGLGGREDARQVAKAYGVHPNSVQLWKRRFVERAPEVFAGDTAVNEYERPDPDLEQLLGKKEVEIALLKNFLGRSG